MLLHHQGHQLSSCHAECCWHAGKFEEMNLMSVIMLARLEPIATLHMTSDCVAVSNTSRMRSRCYRIGSHIRTHELYTTTNLHSIHGQTNGTLSDRTPVIPMWHV